MYIRRYVQDVSTASSDGGLFNQSYTSPYQPPPFSSPTSVTVSQYSNLTPSIASFLLGVNGTGSGQTELLTTFYVGEDTPFWLDVYLGYGGGDVSPGGGRGTIQFTGIGSDFNISRTAQPNGGAIHYQTSGVLVQGYYQLRVYAYGYGGYQQSHYWDGGGDASGYVQFGIPAPSSAALLGVAALGSLRRRR